MSLPTAFDVHLSPRERVVLELIADGMADKQVATHLGMSVRTVRTHLDRVFARHEVHSRTAAVRLLLITDKAADRPLEVDSVRPVL